MVHVLASVVIALTFDMSVNTSLRCDGNVNNSFIANCQQCVSERIWKINEYLATIWTEVWWHY